MTDVRVTDEAVSTALAHPRAVPTAMAGFDPFAMMDRFDEEAFMAEIAGRVADELVYVIKDGGQEVTGLSKQGVDECCMALVTQGQVIREEDLQYEIRGQGETEEALFKCKAARFAVSPDGREVRLDQVIGVKRQPLYYDAALPLTLDSQVPGKKYRMKTYRELLADGEGRNYLAWMAENFREEEVREFVRRLLAGEDVTVQPGRRLNPHWYEHGCMKAARNARFRLIPGSVKAGVIARATAEGKVKRGEIPRGSAPVVDPGKPSGDPGVVGDPGFARMLNQKLPGSPGKWGGYAGKTLGETPTELLRSCSTWAQDKALAAEGAKRKEERATFENIAQVLDLVIAARESGQIPEPPHKDGTPRDPKAEAPSTVNSGGGWAARSSGAPTATPTASTPTTSPPTPTRQREPGED